VLFAGIVVFVLLALVALAHWAKTMPESETRGSADMLERKLRGLAYVLLGVASGGAALYGALRRKPRAGQEQKGDQPDVTQRDTSNDSRFVNYLVKLGRLSGSTVRRLLGSR